MLNEIFNTLLKWLGRHLSKRILGTKFCFPWAMENSTFRHCRAERASFCWILVVFFCHPDNNRSRLEEVPCLDYSLKKFCIFFDRFAEKWLPERQKCKDLSAHRCLLLSMPYFLVLAWASGTFLLGCWAWDCHKFMQKNDMLLQACHRRVDREIGDIYSSMHKCYPFTRMLFNYKTAIVIQVSQDH